MLLTCILYCGIRPGCLIRTIINKCSMLLLIRVIIIFPCLVSLRRRRSFTSRKLYVTVETFVCFFHQFDRHSVSRDRCIGFFLLYPFWHHMILISLAVYDQVCRLFCMLYIPLLGLLQARHDGERSFVWISPCGWYFKNTLYGCSCLCNSYVCENVRHFAHRLRCSSAGWMSVKVQLSAVLIGREAIIG